ncbi:hypothetical protein CLU81_5124 [Flavobacterium sp. 9]|uniref:hypothetical protein n=1 Tax=Flavobacterium sp. 9 TaxID=2035198 RepID=UPI000C535684|nr:hypothetical protein [Flavobacterium sp. 9]PIF34476.1 hypothetical protein CLU81_5124 [Flavobacterium sp. 9]
MINRIRPPAYNSRLMYVRSNNKGINLFYGIFNWNPGNNFIFDTKEHRITYINCNGKGDETEG